MHTYIHITDSVKSVAFSSNGRYLATGSLDYTANLIDLENV